MHAYTTAIGVFEAKIVEIRLAYRLALAANVAIDLKAIEERDAAWEQCLWAIDLLHDAYIEDTLQPVTQKSSLKVLQPTI